MEYLYVPTDGDSMWQGGAPEEDDFEAIEAGDCACVRFNEASNRFELCTVESEEIADAQGEVKTVYKHAWEAI